MKVKINKPSNTIKTKTVYCDECKYEFSMNTVNIEEAIININKQELKLVYFTCPKCNKIYRISLEDKQCEELRSDLEKIKKRIRKNCGSGNDKFASTLNEMVVKKHERLKNHLNNLGKKFPGTFTFVASENNYEDKIIKYLP